MLRLVWLFWYIRVMVPGLTQGYGWDPKRTLGQPCAFTYMLTLIPDVVLWDEGVPHNTASLPIL